MALGELKCPSLSYVYDMTWAEFCIRLYAYNRQQKNELYNLRFLAYHSLIAPNYDPKKLPKTMESFLPMDSKAKKDVTDIMKERIKQAQEQYIKDRDNG